jgi:hypothetical protein
MYMYAPLMIVSRPRHNLTIHERGLKGNLASLGRPLDPTNLDLGSCSAGYFITAVGDERMTSSKDLVLSAWHLTIDAAGYSNAEPPEHEREEIYGPQRRARNGLTRPHGGLHMRPSETAMSPPVFR